MTVRELMSRLAEMPSDAYVYIPSQTGGWMQPSSVYDIDDYKVKID